MNRCANIVLLVATFIALETSVWAQHPRQSVQLSEAEKRWGEFGASSYTYKLRVGGVFGSSDYLVKVEEGACKARRIGGIGIGKPRFRDRFRYEPGCEGWTIRELLERVQFDLARGFSLTDIEFDAKYGFVRKASLDSTEVADQGWGFEVMEFRVSE
jgi:hypothetical protein